MAEVQVNSATQFIGFIIIEPLLHQQIILGIQTSSINYPMDKVITNVNISLIVKLGDII